MSETNAIDRAPLLRHALQLEYLTLGRTSSRASWPVPLRFAVVLAALVAPGEFERLAPALSALVIPSSPPAPT